jgi:hypothetical protein
VRLGGEQDQLHRCHPERLGGPLEQGLQLGHDLRRARQGAHRLVEEAQLGAAPALGQVGAVGKQQQRRRWDQQQPGLRTSSHHGRGGQPEAGVAERDRPVRDEHVQPLVGLQAPLGQADGDPDADVGDERIRRDPREGGQPDDRLERIVTGGQGVHHDQRRARPERELGDVEERLEGRDLAVQQQRRGRADEPRQHQLGGIQEEQAHHQGQLAQGEGVRAAAEVEVHHPALRGREAGGDRPPRHVHRRRCHLHVLDDREVHRRGQRGHDAAEDPDLRLQPERPAQDAHCPTPRSPWSA